MSVVNLTSVVCENNPAAFLDPYRFEITFECLSELREDLEWRLVYVSSAKDAKLDQELESALVGPVPVGVSKFVLEAPPPNTSTIPASDLLDVTVILLIGSYCSKEFVRVGYYVRNEYEDEELRENPPSTPDFTKLRRSILAEKPRVTRIPIEWDATPMAIDDTSASAPLTPTTHQKLTGLAVTEGDTAMAL